MENEGRRRTKIHRKPLRASLTDLFISDLEDGKKRIKKKKLQKSLIIF